MTGPTGPTGGPGPSNVTTTALTTIGFVASPIGTTITAVAPTLVCSQNIVLGSEYYFTNKVFGLLGNITLQLSGSHTLAWTAKIGKNGGTKSSIVGYGYFSDVESITVPVNLISYISTGFVNYTIGDTVNIEIYAQNVGGGSDPTIATAVPLIQGVYNALSNTNVVPPPSGPLSKTSTTAGPTLVNPADTYTVVNDTGVATDLYVYPSATLTRTFSQSIAIAGTSTSVTGNQYIDLIASTAPPAPIISTFTAGLAPYSTNVDDSTFTFASGTDTQVAPANASIIQSNSTFGSTSDFTMSFTAPTGVSITSPNSITYPPSLDGLYINLNGLSSFSSIGMRIYANNFEYSIVNNIDPPYQITVPYTAGQTIKVTFKYTGPNETKLYVGGSLVDTSALIGPDDFRVDMKAQALLSPITLNDMLYTNEIV